MILIVKDPKDLIGLNTMKTLITLRPKDLNDLNIGMLLNSKFITNTRIINTLRI